MAGKSIALASAAGGPYGAVIAGAISGIQEFGTEIMSLASQVKGAIDTMASFVSALNPSVVLQYNQSLRVLNATIGSGLMGAFQEAISGLNDLSATLFPVMQDLAPIFQGLARIVRDYLTGVIQEAAVAFQFLAPIIQYLVDLAEGLVGIWRTLISVLSAFALMGPKLDMKDMIDGLRASVGYIIRYLVTFGAYLAQAFGMLDAYNKNINRLLGEKKLGEGAATPGLTNAGMRGFEDIARDFALQAALAASGGNKEDWIKIK